MTTQQKENLNRVKEISEDFLSEYIPACHAAMITGSSSTLEMTKTSDIDILILDNNTLLVR